MAKRPARLERGTEWVALLMVLPAIVGAAWILSTPTGSGKGLSSGTAACTQVGSEYPLLLDPTSTTPFFPSVPSFNGSGGNLSFPGGPPPLPKAPANVTDGMVAVMFGQVCPLPEFGAALATAGAQNFTLGGGGNYSSGDFFVSFGFAWAAPCPAGESPGEDPCAYQTYWVGNFSTLQTSGPYSEVGPAIYHGPASTPNAPAAGSTPVSSTSTSGWTVACALWGSGALVVGGSVWADRRRVAPSPASPPVPSRRV